MKYLSKGAIVFSIIALALFFYIPSNGFLNQEINTFYYVILAVQIFVIIIVDGLSEVHPRARRFFPATFVWPIILCILALPILQEAASEFIFIFAINGIVLGLLYAIVNKVFKNDIAQPWYYLLFTVFFFASAALLFANVHDFFVNKSGLDTIPRAVGSLKRDNIMSVDQKIGALDGLGEFCNDIYSPVKMSVCMSSASTQISEIKRVAEVSGEFVRDPKECNKMSENQKYNCQSSIIRNITGYGIGDISTCKGFDAGSNTDDNRPRQDLTSDDCYSQIAYFTDSRSLCKMVINDGKRMECENSMR